MSFTIGTAYTKGAGYYRNDDTPSGGKRSEADIRTCPHCQAIIKMQQWDVIQGGGKGGGWCSKCFAPICKACVPLMAAQGCTPFLAQLEATLELGHKFREFLQQAGMGPAQPPRPIFTGLLNQTER